MAVEHNAKLVPVVVLGEISALQNPIDLPGLQRWTYKNLGFPVPYWVVGRWGVSPFPKRSGLKFIIGEPISPRPHVPGTKVHNTLCLIQRCAAPSSSCVRAGQARTAALLQASRGSSTCCEVDM